MSANTSSPGRKRVAWRPAASTRPAMSDPRMWCRGRNGPMMREYSGFPRSASQSDALRDTACTWTSTSSSFGTGVSARPSAEAPRAARIGCRPRPSWLASPGSVYSALCHRSPGYGAHGGGSRNRASPTVMVIKTRGRYRPASPCQRLGHPQDRPPPSRPIQPRAAGLLNSLTQHLRHPCRVDEIRINQARAAAQRPRPWSRLTEALTGRRNEKCYRDDGEHGRLVQVRPDRTDPPPPGPGLDRCVTRIPHRGHLTL